VGLSVLLSDLPWIVAFSTLQSCKGCNHRNREAGQQAQGIGNGKNDRVFVELAREASSQTRLSQKIISGVMSHTGWSGCKGW